MNLRYHFCAIYKNTAISIHSQTPGIPDSLVINYGGKNE